jgi:hypothetical protein
MPYCRDNDRVLILVKDYTPVTDPKSQTVAPLKTLHITMPRFGKPHQSLVNPTANI